MQKSPSTGAAVQGTARGVDGPTPGTLLLPWPVKEGIRDRVIALCLAADGRIGIHASAEILLPLQVVHTFESNREGTRRDALCIWDLWGYHAI
jgi:hypothetical protein